MKLPKRLLERFESIQILGETVESSVHCVRERATLALCTLKWIPDATLDAARAIAAEFELLRDIQHPNLTQVLEFDRLEDGVFLLREYVDGTTLWGLPTEAALDQRRAIFLSIVRGLAHLHGRGIVHGDLKPENVLLRRVKGGFEAVLTDFGFSGRIGRASRGARGTPPYIAPELLLGLPPDERSDLFSLGVTWLVASPLRPAIDERKLYARFPNEEFLVATEIDPQVVDSEFAALLLPLLRTLPAERPRNAIDLLERIDVRAKDAIEASALEPLLRPSHPFLSPEQVTAPQSSMGIAAATIARTAAPFTALLGASSAIDAREASRWIRFLAARAARPILTRSEIDTAVRSLASLDPADGSSAASARGLDAARARATVEFAVDRTILITPDLALAYGRDYVLALARAVARLGENAPPLVVLVPIDEREPLRNDSFQHVVAIEPIDRDSLAADLARLEAGTTAKATDRIEGLATRLLELCGSDSEQVASLLSEALAAGTIRVFRGHFDFSRFEPRHAPGSIADRVARLSTSAQECLAAIEILGGRAHLTELSGVLDREAFAQVATRTKNSEILVVDDRLETSPASLGALALEALPKERLRDLAKGCLELDLRERCPYQRAEIAVHAGDLVRAAEESSQEHQARRDPRALASLERLFQAFPKRSRERNHAGSLLARSLAESGRLEESIARLEGLAVEGCDEVAAEIATHARLGLVLVASGRAKDAEPMLERAKTLLRESRIEIDSKQRADIERGIALVRAASGDLPGAIQRLQLAMRGSGKSDSVADPGLPVLLGALQLREGKFAAARKTLETALDLARRAGDLGALAASATNLATIEQREGALERARALLREALDLRSRRGELYEEAIVRNNLALVLRDHGDLEGAERELHESAALRRRMGDEVGASIVDLNLASVEALRGRFDKASPRVAHAVSTLLRNGATIDEKLIAAARLLEVGRVAGWTSELRSEFEALEVELERTRRDGNKAAAPKRALGEYCLARAARCEDPRDAVRLAREAENEFERCGDRLGNARALLEVARRQLEIEDPTSARREVGKARRLALPRLEPEVAMIAGAISAASGAHEEALSLFERARAGAAGMGLSLTLAETLLREIDLLRSIAPLRVAPLVRELRVAMTSIELPGGEPDLLVRLRRIYGRLVAPDFRMEAHEPEPLIATAEGRVVTEGIPEEVFRTFVMINRSVLREQDFERLLERLLEHAVALSGARRGFVVLLRDGKVVFEARSGELDPENEEISQGIVREAIEQMRPMLTANAKADSRLTGRKSIERFDLRSVLCVPFKCRTGTVGAIYVDNPVREGVFKARTVDLLEALASQAAIAIGNIEHTREIERLNEELKKRVAVREVELEQARRELVKTGVADGARRMIAQADSMRQVIDVARRVAKSDLPVLILGESGSGKELLARFTHEASARCARAFVAENCSAIPETLLESEFFGCVKGAFTGADQDREGLFQQADGGTLFLDEIGDMPLPLQAKILRALQEKSIRRLGSSVATPVDVRLICATHRNLETMVRENTFREDLYYRVRGVELKLPPLRERREDIPLLVESVLERLNTRNGTKKRAGKVLLHKLVEHDWPGNVRELESEITRLFHLSPEDELDIAELALRSRQSPSEEASSVAFVRPMAEIERDAIKLALRETGGNREEAARKLQISRAAFYVKLKAYGLQESSPPSRRRKS